VQRRIRATRLKNRKQFNTEYHGDRQKLTRKKNLRKKRFRSSFPSHVNGSLLPSVACAPPSKLGG
jgi:hypothetical protein